MVVTGRIMRIACLFVFLVSAPTGKQKKAQKNLSEH